LFEWLLYIALIMIIVPILFFIWGASAKIYTCLYCGKKESAGHGVDMQKKGSTLKEHVCRECFQKEILDKQSTCPNCNKPMIIGESTLDSQILDNFGKYIVDDKWYHLTCLNKQAYLDRLSSQSPSVVKETIKEVVVKTRCSYCGNLYDERNDKCPHCGARHL